MQGKNKFTSQEIEQVRLMVKKYYQAKTASDQKSARTKLRKIGFYVSDFGIQNITPQIFEKLIETGKISIVRNDQKNFSQPIPEKPIKLIITLNDYIDFEKKLIEGSFVKAGTIDDLIPEVTGFYCIKLAEGSTLPERYQKHISNRNHKIIYIGKAEGQCLRKRFLGQELRAKGHGTFFRSIGAVLGYLPEKGSLLNYKNKKNYTFKPSDESKIINWINSNLEVNWISFDGDFSIEKNWISKYCPLLNDIHNPRKLRELKEDKAYCRAVANG